MRVKVVLSFLLLGVVLSAAPVLRISKENAVSIVHGVNAAVDEKTVALELKEYIERMCGAKCSVVAEGSDVKSPAIYVGETEFAKKAILDYGKLEAEQWVMKTVGGNLILGGGRPRGTVYAVYEFLEMQGIVWPTETIEYVPKKNEIAIEAMDVRDKPAMQYRGVYSGLAYNSLQLQHYLAHNKMNTVCGIQGKWGANYLPGRPGSCHTFHAYSKPEWPDEYFSLNDKGKRVRSVNSSGPGHFCLTNPDLQKAMAARLREFIELDRKDRPREMWPVIYDVSHNDTANQCVCENCKRRAEEEGSYAGPMLDLINYMANDIAKDYPDVLVQTFAYTWTLDAPKHIKPAKNVVIRICKLGCEFYPHGKADTLSVNTHPRNQDYYDNFMKWSKIATNMVVWDYWIIYSRNHLDAPYLNARNLCKDIKFYSENNVRGMFVECERASSTSFYNLKYWLGLKAMQNPNMDYGVMLDRFCTAAYGPSAAPMRELIEYLQDRREQADKPIGRCDTILKRTFTDFVKNDKMPDILPYTDRAFYEKANALLDEAETLAANSPDNLLNVRRERIPIDTALLNTYTKYVDNPPSGRLVAKDYKALYDRNEANRIAQARYFYEKPFNNPTNLKTALDMINLDRTLTFASETDVPEELKGRKIRVFAWPSIRLESGGKSEEDKDAFSGRTAKLAHRDSKDYYRIPYRMGTYTYRDKKGFVTYSIEEKDIPQDEKYHLYHIGRSPVVPKTLVWLHWTWLIQAYIDSVYVEGGDNEWDVYVSLKLTGEPYVKGSKTQPGVYVDRIILAK